MTALLCLVSIMLVPFAAAGLALIHQGLGRSRSAAHSMLATLCALAVAAIVFAAFGFSLAGYPGGPAYRIVLRGTAWNWLGAEPLLTDPNGLFRLLTLALQIFTVGLAATIPISSGTDRWRLGAICASSALLGGITYPLFSHWVWGGGWLAQLKLMFGIGSFTDLGGAGVTQVTGGLTALAVAWILGPRRGKYTSDGIASAIPGHNIVLVLFGCLLTLVGWIGLESASSLLFYGATPEFVARSMVNAMLAASASCLSAVATTQLRYRKPDASISANGWVAGLVAGSAGCGSVPLWAAVTTGLVAGILVTLLVETFELRLMVDDPGGAISVHAGAGLWGLLASGLFGTGAGTIVAGRLLPQLVGIATLLGFVFPVIYGANLTLNRILPYRVDTDGDWQGMDIRELGAGAYPEFVIHADEFVPR